MAGYIRQKDAEIVDDAVIFAEDLKVEFDTVQAAMDAALGHSHGGGIGEGAPITLAGPAQDYIFTNTFLKPKTTATYDVGSASFKFKDAYFSGSVSLAALTASGVISGDGSGLTNLPATSLTGTIADARIPTAIVRDSRAINTGSGLSGGGNLTTDRTLSVDSTVVRTTGNQTLEGTKTFSSTIIGNLTGNVNGDLTGNVTGNLTGTASNATTAVTLTGLTSTISQLNSLNNMSSPTVTQYVTENRGWTFGSYFQATSGTAFDWTNIPTWASEIVITFWTVQLSSTGHILVQIGNVANGLTTANYSSSSGTIDNGGGQGVLDASSGHCIYGASPGASFTGQMHLIKDNITGEFWNSTHLGKRGAQTVCFGGGWNTTVVSNLSRVRVTRIGSDTFVAGSLYVLWR